MHSDSTTHSEPAPSVLYLGTDAGLRQRIRALLKRAGITLLAATGPVDLRAAAQLPRCAVVILDTALLCANETIREFMETLRWPGTQPPMLVVIAHADDMEWRLQAKRADAAGFFVAPLLGGKLVAQLITLCQPGPAAASRVLVVDGSATQVLPTERILSTAGFVVRTLNDASRVLEVVAAFQPDLILMDLQLPLASGAELAAIIRDDEAGRLVPILLFADEPDPQRQADALSRGGDAFISKSIRPDLLVRIVARRIDAMGALRRGLATTEHLDPDTGLATRRHFINSLERARAEANDVQSGRGLLMVALEGPARINEQLGTGAALLATDRIGRLIVERLTPSDLAVRLDDYRYALLVRRESADQLHVLAEGLRAAVSGTPVRVAGHAVTVGVSVGLGLFQPDSVDAVTLIARAGDACDRALAGGGGCLLADAPASAAPLDEDHERRMTALVVGALAGADRATGFRLFYQPMVAVQRQGLQYVEVMLRLVAGDGVLHTAADFLPSAERAARVSEIDRWIMVRALAVLMQQCHAQPGLRLFVRQHVASLISDEWVPWLRAQVLAHGLAQRRPILELHLDDLFGHRQMAGTLIESLRKIGIEVCLADVTNSPAALDLVSELRPAFVKLGAAIVLETKPQPLNELVACLTRAGAEVIAAGIDQPALVGRVWASGVRFAQGAAIQAPLPEPVFDLGEVEVA